MTNFRGPRFLLPLVLLGALLLAMGCRSAETRTTSQAKLKSALLALDRGDEGVAEQDLEASLRADPNNARARIMLASIHASRAGIFLQGWLDPLVEAGQQLSAKMRTYKESYEIVSRIGTSNEDGQENAPELGRAEDSRSEEVKRRILHVHNNLGKLAIGTVVTIDLFRGVPYFHNPEMARSLDRAIEILRADNANPDLRQEEVRVYLSVLSLIRFVYYTRDFVGSFDKEARALFTQASRFCKADASEVRDRVAEIHKSLLMLDEGLRVSDAEAASSKQRKSRRKLHTFVKKILLGDDWQQIDRFFQKGSEENTAAMRMFRHFCGIEGTKLSEIKRGKQAEAGASLFDPDLE